MLQRIQALAVPPAWTDVWISPDDRGHIQAVGLDSAGRKQYRYHDEWRRQRDRRKFAHLADLAAALPKLRRRVAADLAGRGLSKRRVLAAAIRLLDRAAIRVGGEPYAVDDPDLGEATFGLATLRREHVTVHGARIDLCFPGKGGAVTDIQIEDAPAAAVIRALLRRGDSSQELFGYWDGRNWRDVRSADINEYLREASGADLTAKDFRTWHGTVAALVSLCAAGECVGVTAERRAVAAAMRDAAGLLGNTAAVAKASYVDPRVVDLYTTAALPPLAVPAEVEDGSVAEAAYADPKAWAAAEELAISVLA